LNLYFRILALIYFLLKPIASIFINFLDFIFDKVYSVSNNIDAPMLLGQSVMEKFGRFTFDYADQKLILE